MAKNSENNTCSFKTSIGGQALMEGIMMRGPEKTVMCVRRANGEIVSETIENVKPNKANKIPIVRGVVSFVQSMTLGTKLLMRSAEIAIEDEIAAEKAEEEKAAAENAEAVEEAAEETAEAVEDTAEETAEAVEETAEETVEAVEEAAEETVEAVEETAEETAEAVEETAEDTAEAVEEAAEKSVEKKKEKAVAKKIEKAAEPTEKKQKKGGKFLRTLGCILCLALAAFLFFRVAPIATTALTGTLFPSVMPQSILDKMAAAPEKWEFITSIVVKVIFLLVMFGLISLITRDPEKAKEKKKKNDDSFESGPLLVLSTILGFGLALLLFVYAPTWITSALFKWAFPSILPQKAAEHMATQAAQNVWRPVIEGIIKIIILVAYMAICSTMKEIKTLFSYHGAEHKTIFCYEAGEELTVENVRKFKRFHPRCGTSFLILMLLVGIIAGMAIKYLLPADIANSNLWYPLIKIGLIPLIMGVGYELLKMCGKHDNALTRIIAAPGLWMQRITTKEPTDAMIECAIAAIKPVIPENGEDMQ